jgi:hypothetical protein
MKTTIINYNSKTDKLMFELSQVVDQRTFSEITKRFRELIVNKDFNSIIIPANLISNVIVLKNKIKIDDKSEVGNLEIHTPTRMLRIIEDKNE